MSGQEMAHVNGNAVLAGAKLHSVAGAERRNLLILVAGGLSMIEHYVMHQVDDHILPDTSARVRLQLDAQIAA